MYLCSALTFSSMFYLYQLVKSMLAEKNEKFSRSVLTFKYIHATLRQKAIALSARHFNRKIAPS